MTSGEVAEVIGKRAVIRLGQMLKRQIQLGIAQEFDFVVVQGAGHVSAS